jgi:serine/threonine protein kinase/ankyrin repeat protein
MQTDWEKLNHLFHEALRQPPSNRAAFLASACENDEALRDELVSLLAVYDPADSFLELPLLSSQVLEALKDIPAALNELTADVQEGSLANSETSTIHVNGFEGLGTMQRLIGTVIDGKYRIEVELGKGGMGNVFRATHLGTSRPVALKMIAPQYMANPMFVERFKREAQAMGRLRHPNVINVTDFGFASVGSVRLAYLVMEYLNGLTLRALMKRRPQLPLGFVVDVVEQICLAIDEAHKQGILHRDLKPDNVWLEPTGRGDYNVKVLDFGLAKLRYETSLQPSRSSVIEAPIPTSLLPTVVMDNEDSSSMHPSQSSDINALTQKPYADQTSKASTVTERETKGIAPTHGTIDPRTVPENLTRAGMVLGTPLYMSPEQCRGESLDTRTDIYSVGIIAYQMLAGETPFIGTDIDRLRIQQSEMPPPALRKKRHDIPKPLEQLVMSALAKRRDDRPSNAAAFSTAFRLNAEGEVPLLRQAFDLFRKHQTVFLNLGVAIYLPALILNFLLLSSTTMLPLGRLLPGTLVSFTRKAELILSFVIILFTSLIHTSACAAVVQHLRRNPQNEVKTSHILLAVIKRLGALLRTAIRGTLEFLIACLKLTGFRKRSLVGTPLYGPIVVLEEKQGGEATRRAQELLNRVRSLVFALQAREIFIGVITILYLAAGFVFLSAEMPVPAEVIRGILTFCLVILPACLFLSMTHSVIGIAFSNLYFKARQAGGELLDEDSDQTFDYLEVSNRPQLSRKRPIAFLIIMFMVLLFGAAVLRFGLLGEASKGSANRTKALLAVGVNPNSIVSGMGPPLIIAAYGGHTDTVKVLLDQGANVNAKGNNDYDLTALIAAVGGHHIDTMRLLLERGADVNAMGHNGRTALWLAAKKGYSDIIELLLDAGANVNQSDRSGRTALMEATQEGHRDAVKLLLDRGANAHATDMDGKSALVIAETRGDTELIQLLSGR